MVAGQRGNAVTQQEMIDTFRKVGHVTNESSLHGEETPDPLCRHNWRCIVCYDGRDINECSKCGRQEEHACDFDDDFA